MLRRSFHQIFYNTWCVFLVYTESLQEESNLNSYWRSYIQIKFERNQSDYESSFINYINTDITYLIRYEKLDLTFNGKQMISKIIKAFFYYNVNISYLICL